MPRSHIPSTGRASRRFGQRDDYLKKTTPPGQLAILKFIPFNGDDQPYDAFWKTVFPGGAEFSVYKADDWDGSAPKSGATPAATYSLTVNDATHTVPLEPGSYVVWETDAPGGTTRGSAVPVTIVSGETATAEYYNAASYGLLTFNKLGAGDAPLANAEFALKLDGSTVATAKSNIDGSVYLSAPAGEYQLVETLAPSGYVKADPISVTVTSGTTTQIDDIVDEMSTATLSIAKYAVTREGDAPFASEDITGIQNVASVNDFSFTLSWSESDGGVVTNPSQVIHLGTNGTATIPDLKRVDADGNWISYTLVENAPDDSAFVKDDASYTWTLRQLQGPLSGHFFNVLKGRLRIKKQQMDLDAAAVYPSGKGFKLYRKSGSDYALVTSLTTGSGGTAEAASSTSTTRTAARFNTMWLRMPTPPTPSSILPARIYCRRRNGRRVAGLAHFPEDHGQDRDPGGQQPESGQDRNHQDEL
jgi:hypothetical protein